MANKKLKTVAVEEVRDIVLRQHNNLIEAREACFTLLEQKIIAGLYALRQNNRKYRGEEQVYINAREITELVGISTDSYRLFKNAMDNIMSTVVYIKHLESNKETRFNLISTATYEEGTATIKFNSDMDQFLTELNRNYTEYKVGVVKPFKYRFSIRLYQLLLSYQKRYIWSKYFDLSELRSILGVPKDKYLQYKNFRMRCLEDSKKDIEAYTDLRFDYEQQKCGRRIVGVRFYIDLHTNTNTPFPDLIPEKELREYLFSALTELDFSVEEIEDLIQKYTSKKVLTNYSYTVQEQKRKEKTDKPIVKIKAYLLKAVREDYAKF